MRWHLGRVIEPRRDIGAVRATHAVLVGATIALLAATIVVVADDGNDPEGPASSRTTETGDTATSEAEDPVLTLDDLSGSARELAELLAEGRESTYHARYTGRAAEGEGAGTIVLESWAKGGRFRQDTIVDVAGEPFHRSNFLLDRQAVACTRLGSTEWTCEESAVEQAHGADILGGGSLDQLARAAVGEEAGEVDGRPARCFVITLDAQTTELCASDQGVPLRIRSQNSELVVEVLDQEVDDAVFEPPSPTT